jgi:hypothetical protein
MSALTEPKKKFQNSSIAFPDIVVVVLASYSQIPDGVVVVDALMRTAVLHRVSIFTQNFREGAANYDASVRNMGSDRASCRGSGRLAETSHASHIAPFDPGRRMHPRHDVSDNI